MASNGDMTWSSEIRRGKGLIWEVTSASTPDGWKPFFLRFPDFDFPMKTGQQLRIELTTNPTSSTYPQGSIFIEKPLAGNDYWESGEISQEQNWYIAPSHEILLWWFIPIEVEGQYSNPQQAIWRVESEVGFFDLCDATAYNSDGFLDIYYCASCVIEYKGNYDITPPEIQIIQLSGIIVVELAVLTGCILFTYRRRTANDYWRILAALVYLASLHASILFAFFIKDAVKIYMEPILSICMAAILIVVFNWLWLLKTDKTEIMPADLSIKGRMMENVKALRSYISERGDWLLIFEFLLFSIPSLLVFGQLELNSGVLDCIMMFPPSLRRIIFFVNSIFFGGLALIALLILYQNRDSIKKVSAKVKRAIAVMRE